MPTALTPEQRKLRAQIAVNTRWSRVPRSQRAAHTAKAREALWQRYLDAVPAEVTDPAERAELARQARSADLSRLSLARSRARTATAQDAREAQAVAGHDCPECGRPAGKRCGAPGTLAGRPKLHPHPGRLALVPEDQP